jgi:hypothetical protein
LLPVVRGDTLIHPAQEDFVVRWISRVIGGLGALTGGLAGVAITLFVGLLGIGQSRPEYWGNYLPFLFAGLFILGAAVVGFIGLIGPSAWLLLLAGLGLGIPSVIAGALGLIGPVALQTNPLLALVFGIPSLLLIIAAACARPSSIPRERTHL